jgi:hypothetical protein
MPVNSLFFVGFLNFFFNVNPVIFSFFDEAEQRVFFQDLNDLQQQYGLPSILLVHVDGINNRWLNG